MAADGGAIAPLVDAIGTPVAIVELGSGCILHANGAARAMAFAYNMDDEHVYVTDSSGARVSAEHCPRARAARGEAFRNWQLRWQLATEARSLVFHAAPAAIEGQTVSVLSFTECTPEQGGFELRSSIGIRDEFLSIATHELRSPLQTLQLVLQRIQRSAKRNVTLSCEEVLRQLEPGLRQIERMANLVQNLLDVSRIRGNRFELELEHFNLCELVTESVEALTEQAKIVGSELDVAACDSCEGYWDRTRMGQVLNNLVTNALKYGGSKPVAVRLHREDDSAVLAVQDSGIGIAEADMERIFNPFERAASEFRAHSLGLGLYIVREIVHAHGGSVDVESTPGEGSTFTVRLPIKAEAPKEELDGGTERD